MLLLVVRRVKHQVRVRVSFILCNPQDDIRILFYYYPQYCLTFNMFYFENFVERNVKVKLR